MQGAERSRIACIGFCALGWKDADQIAITAYNGNYNGSAITLHIKMNLWRK